MEQWINSHWLAKGRLELVRDIATKCTPSTDGMSTQHSHTEWYYRSGSGDTTRHTMGGRIRPSMEGLFLIGVCKIQWKRRPSEHFQVWKAWVTGTTTCTLGTPYKLIQSRRSNQACHLATASITRWQDTITNTALHRVGKKDTPKLNTTLKTRWEHHLMSLRKGYTTLWMHKQQPLHYITLHYITRWLLSAVANTKWWQSPKLHTQPMHRQTCMPMKGNGKM